MCWEDNQDGCYVGWLPAWGMGVPPEKEEKGREADKRAGKEAWGAWGGVTLPERKLVMGKDMQARVEKERELYNKGIDRKKYNAHFGASVWGQTDMQKPGKRTLCPRCLRGGREKIFWNWEVLAGIYL